MSGWDASFPSPAAAVAQLVEVLTSPEGFVDFTVPPEGQVTQNLVLQVT